MSSKRNDRTINNLFRFVQFADMPIIDKKKKTYKLKGFVYVEEEDILIKDMGGDGNSEVDLIMPLCPSIEGDVGMMGGGINYSRNRRTTPIGSMIYWI